ncbi:Methyltransferase type 11 [Rippkaea orientalis PCC 8801]|uniref:Methyltransferase type 11 n=1 Tax=Rippkaea orientalis (strain PCC 8801 / RF-1) TaxID=41431 RepID=B7K0F6_RIPO1|nr:class I SAM-dependent methyltransferase [Rippkaea orientalis]ACK67440.1 Methyltransferase type 11 [Rippkaea orientalis PCC 8801]
MKDAIEAQYIHGYGFEERDRLIRQAYYWKDSLILKDLALEKNKKLLEIGCGVGAVLGILGKHYPDLSLAGIDLESYQINSARDYLEELGLYKVDLRQGNINNLPWDDHQFDYVYGIWILEHINDPLPCLKEVYRVLKPGGKIILTETDLKTLLVYPDTPELNYLNQGLWDLFVKNGNPYIGRRLGQILEEVGFQNVENKGLGFNFWNQELRLFVDYLNEWLPPTIPQMVEQLGLDKNTLEAGLNYWQNVPSLPSSVASAVVYRAQGWK